MKALQDNPIPSDVKQDEILRMMDARVSGVEDDLEYIKRKLYNK